MKKEIIIGVDEAGRGPRAGPVVAAAFCNLEEKINKSFFESFCDSKSISEKKRKIIYENILEFSKTKKIYFGIGEVGNKIIDEIGIKKANKKAMELALEELFGKINNLFLCHSDPETSSELSESLKVKFFEEKFISNSKNIQKQNISMFENYNFKIIVDGNDNYKFENFEKFKTEFLVKGDSKIKEIGAASIIAKTFRDEIMENYGKIYPKYFFEKHKGYGTKKHILALKEFGITKIHRKSYKPIKNILFCHSAPRAES